MKKIVSLVLTLVISFNAVSSLAAGLYNTYFVKRGLADITDLNNWFNVNPAKIFNLPVNKIEVNSPANITVLDVNTEREYTLEEIVSLSKNTPFIGDKLTGYPVYTIVNGKVVYKYEA